MRILLVSEDIPYPSMGGLAKHVLTLAKALVKAGHKVDLLGGNQHPIEVTGEEGQFGGQFFGQLQWHLAGWKETKIGLFLPFKRPWIAKKMAKCIMTHAADYDVIHYHGHYPNIANFIPKAINFVQTRHDQGGECIIHCRFRNNTMCTSIDPIDCAGCITPKPNALQRFISALSVRNYRRDAALAFRRHKTIFVSDMLKRNFSRVAGSEDWGTVVHHFIDLDKIKEAMANNPIATQKNHTAIKLFFAGMLYPHKGIDELLTKLVPVMPQNMTLQIAGTSPIAETYKKKYTSKQLSFLGFCDYTTVLNCITNADIMIVPSICEESFGATTLEGLLLGKPTFALERGGTPELKIYERYPGQLHLHKDMDELVSELINFIPKPSNCHELDGRGGVDYALRYILDIYQAHFTQS